MTRYVAIVTVGDRPFRWHCGGCRPW